MLFLSPLLMFYVMIFFSLFFCSMSTSFFFIWLSLEINMISVLPILSAKESFFNSELSLKYFVSQSIASILFLGTVFILTYFPQFLLNSILAISIIFKMGIPPFQSWFVSISLISSYPSLWILSTVQKFIPIQIIFLVKLNEKLSAFLIFSSLFMIMVAMKNISSVRMMLIFSAFGNSLWMIVVSNYSKFWIFYLILYSCMLASALSYLKIYSINKIFSFGSLSLVNKLSLNMNLLNLAGLPPFTGFLIKIFALKILIMSTPMLMLFLLVFLSLSVLTSYLMLSFYSFSLVKGESLLTPNSFSPLNFTMSFITVVAFPLSLVLLY